MRRASLRSNGPALNGIILKRSVSNEKEWDYTDILDEEEEEVEEEEAEEMIKRHWRKQMRQHDE